MGFRSQHTGPIGYPKQLSRGDNRVPEGQLFADSRRKVFSHVAHPRYTPSQDPSSILIEDSRLSLVKCPRILGVYLDPSLSFNKHSHYVSERVSSRNNILKALAATSWGQQKETLRMTYKAVGRAISNYAAPVWSPNLHDANYKTYILR